MANKLPTVLVGMVTPSHFYYPREHVSNMLNMMSYSYERGVIKKTILYESASPSTALNRNNVLEKALKYEANYALMIDTDMTFEMDLLFHLIKTSENNPGCVVSGIGCIGKPPFFPAMYTWNKDIEDHHEHILGWDEMKLLKVDAVGSFGMLIPLDVIKKLPKDPFDHIYEFFPEKEKQAEREMRHDMAFSKRCRDAKIPIIINPQVKLGHLRLYSSTVDDYKLNRDFKKPNV